MEKRDLRLGTLLPYFNSAMEPDLAALRPEGVSHQTARFVLDANVIDDIVGSAEKLCACGIEALIVGISTDSFPNGLEILRDGMERVGKAIGKPVFAPSFAVFAALRALGTSRVALVTPFDDAANERVRAGFESEGFGVVGQTGLAQADLAEIGNTSPEAIAELFAAGDAPEAEALVQVGTGLPMAGRVADLEARFGKPVVASNPAVYWQALRACGRDDRVAGAGRLLSDH